jgi:pimeloyl-ACP methyl ester carboxylesterase
LLAVTAPTDFSASVAGGSLGGWVSGRGDPVLVLHGGPGLSDYTEGLSDELKSAFTVYRCQQRGLPPSTLEGPFDISTHVDDALAVFDANDLDQVWLVGHSWGGHLALFFASLHPERCRGILCVDPQGAVGDGGEADLAANVTARLTPEARARAMELDQRATDGEESEQDAAEGLRLIWPGYFADPASAPPMPDIDLSVECFTQTVNSVNLHLDQQTLAKALPSITVPASFVLGAQSPIPPIHGYRTANLLPSAFVHEIDDCGHFVWMEQPGVTLQALRRLSGV